jgi:hypothetical protein
MGLLSETDLDPAIVAKLEEHGITTTEEAEEATDDDLQEFPGIGPAAVAKIRAAKPVEDDEDEVGIDDDPPTDDEDEDPPADEGEGAEDAEVDEKPAPRPAPRPRPRASTQAPAPRGCQWMRLRKGVEKITTEVRLPRTGERIRGVIMGGVRYPMPVGVSIGAVGRWHPMVVVEERQPDYDPITLADLDYGRYEIGRKQISHFLAAAQSVIEKQQDAETAKELVSQGPKAVLDRYNALREVKPDEVPPISYHVVDYRLPEGCVPISKEEMAGLLNADELSDPATGKSFANKQDLIRYQVEEQQRAKIPEALRRALDEKLSQGILTVPAGEVV